MVVGQWFGRNRDSALCVSWVMYSPEKEERESE
jgi:hypothetical protein